MEDAVHDGDVKKLAELMRQDPDFKVNMAVEGNGTTLLHHACNGDSRFAVIPLLLAHPDIDVNVKDTDGETPFSYACGGFPSCVREMMKDSRVKVNEPNNDGETPLFWAARYGYLGVIKWWIASGRDMDLGKPGDVDKTDAIGIARKRGKTRVVTLLERFKNDASQTRHAMRLELGWYDEAAAGMFTLVVFVSDGLLQVEKLVDTTSTPAARFFNIARSLPLELQMMLCFRQMGSDKDIVSGKDSEVAFKELAKSSGDLPMKPMSHLPSPQLHRSRLRYPFPQRNSSLRAVHNPPHNFCRRPLSSLI